MSTRNLFGKFDNVLGVDLSEAMIEEAKECWKKENVQFKVSAAEKLPHPKHCLICIASSMIGIASSQLRFYFLIRDEAMPIIDEAMQIK